MWTTMVQDATAFRRELHQFPELAWEEKDTAHRVRQRLTSLGLTWTEHAGTGTTAILAPAAPGKHIALRADIDGLPIQESSGVDWSSTHDGRMHACGHDGHTATLLLTAEWLVRHEQNLPGPVTLIFQPAEEGGHGAKHMIEAGALDGVDAIYGWHNWPGIPEGQIFCPDGVVMAANGTFRITLHGRGGHGSQPEACRDPLAAGAAVVGKLKTLINDQFPSGTRMVVSPTRFHAGESDTVIPDQAVLSGSIRLADDSLRNQLNAKIREAAEEASAPFGVTAEVEPFPRYGSTVNTPAEAARLRTEAAEVFGTTPDPKPESVPVMASEDFSYYLKTCPGAFALIGAGEGPSLHNPQYDFNDALLSPAARLLIRLAGGVDPLQDARPPLATTPTQGMTP